MDKSTEKIIALNESILIWDKIYSKYPYDKFSAIAELYNEGKISKDDYKYGWPLCEKFLKSYCEECPWPGDRDDGTKLRCSYSNSPYKKWEDAVYASGLPLSYEEAKNLAKDVLDLLMSIKIIDNNFWNDLPKVMFTEHG